MDFLHDPRGEHVANQVDEPYIFDALAQAVQDDPLGDRVETLDQIARDASRRAGSIGLGYMAKRLDRVPARLRAIRAIPKPRFVDDDDDS